MTERKAPVLSAQEFKRVESICMNKPKFLALRNRAMLYFSFELGLRACEITRMNLGDIIKTDKGDLLEEIVLRSKVTKGHKKRLMYLTNKKVRAVIKEYIDFVIMKNKMLGKKTSLNNPLFISRKIEVNGGRFHAKQVTKLFKAIYREAGLENASSHSGRRTFITNKIDAGINISYVALLAGHNNINSTMRYYANNPKILKKISEESIF